LQSSLVSAMASLTFVDASIVATVSRISGDLLATVKMESSWPTSQVRFLLESSLPINQCVQLMMPDGRLLNDFETLQDHGIFQGPVSLTAVLSKVTLAELKLAGWSASDLRRRGYTFQDLASVGFAAREVQKAGASLARLRDLGFSARQLKSSGFTAEEVLAEKFPFRVLLDTFDGHELLRAGITPSLALFAHVSYAYLCVFRDAGITAEELRERGFTAASLLQAGYSFEEVRHAGYPASELLHYCRLRAFWARDFYYSSLRLSGFSAAEILECGCTADELEQIGYTFEEIMKVGLDASALRKAGFTALCLHSAGFSYADLELAGYSAYELPNYDCFSFIAQPTEHTSLQSLLHNTSDRQCSVKRRVNNLLLLNPSWRQKLIDQATSKCSKNDLRVAEKLAAQIQKRLQMQTRSSTQGKVHKRRQYLSDLSL